MKGSIHFKAAGNCWFVAWYWGGKHHKIYKVNGQAFKRMHPDPRRCIGYRKANELLSLMRQDAEAGTFTIEKYTEDGWTDTIPFLRDWLAENYSPVTRPATFKDYRNSIENWLVPFFKEHPCQLHEIQFNVLKKLLHFIDRQGKGKLNVMYCLRAALDYAWRSGKILAVPPFPKRGDYGIIKQPIVWIQEARQIAIINQITEEDRPIFWFLKYMFRRPAEAMAIHREDYDPAAKVFVIHRTISADKLIERTKTGEVHVVPCPDVLAEIIAGIKRGPWVSPFLFTTARSRLPGKRYTRTIMGKLWKDACRAAGEDIALYPGTKHSSAMSFLNEKGGTEEELQVLTDHSRRESVRHYGEFQVESKRGVFNRNVVELVERKAQDGNGYDP